MFPLPAVVALLATSPLPPQVAPMELDKSSVFGIGFDWSGQAIDGGALSADAVEFRFAPSGTNTEAEVAVMRSMTPLQSGVNQFPQRDILETVPVGTWTVTARVRSVAGVWSDFSAAVEAVVTSKKPEAPANVRAVRL